MVFLIKLDLVCENSMFEMANLHEKKKKMWG